MVTRCAVLLTAVPVFVALLLSGCGGTQPTVLSVSTDSLDFRSVELSGSVELSVTLTNAGASASDLFSPALTGDGAPAFAVADAGWPLELEAGASVEVLVTFAPTEAGVHVALLTFTADLPGGVSGGGGILASSSSTSISVALVGSGGAEGDDDDSAGDDDDSAGGDDDDTLGDDDDTTTPTDGDGDGYPAQSGGGDDCDDADAAVHPGALELCDGIDNDCNVLVDDAAVDAETWYLDADNDGYGSSHLSLDSCAAPAGYANNSNDCDDLDPSSYPGAAEVCDGADNDCNNSVDEGVESTFFADADGDGYGASALPVSGCTLPSGASVNDGDCDDSNASVSPLALEFCDSVDNDCNGTVDDGALDATTWYLDSDSDGAGGALLTVTSCSAPPSYVDNSDDCNDLDAAVSPTSPELCNSADDDCDGLIDEDAPAAPTWYLDNDGDTFGGTWLTQQSCTQPSSYAVDSSDCDDTDATAFPGGTEICDSADNDCNGIIDDGVGITWYADSDADGYGDPGTTQGACFAPVGYVSNSGDCDDGNAATNPTSYEICDAVDNNCTGGVDESGALDADDWYIDADGDGFGAAGVPVSACNQPGGYADNDADCDDDPTTGPSVNPNASELCNNLDDDCDGTPDDGAVDAVLWYDDADGDGYGNPGSGALACAQPAGSVQNDTDCNDTELSIHPLAAEVCDTIDNDCDGGVDEGVQGASSACAGIDCQAILNTVPSSPDGIYWLDPDGDGNPSDAWQGWCDMSRDGGGWTLVILNNESVPDNGNLSFGTATQAVTIRGGTMSAGLTGFDLWVGTAEWASLGTEARLEVGAGPLSLNHQAFYTLTLDPTDSYRLNMTVGNVSIGSGEPGMATYHSGRQLSAADADNDSHGPSNCSTDYDHPWWYGACWNGSFWGGNGHLEAAYWTSSNTANAHAWGAIWLR